MAIQCLVADIVCIALLWFLSACSVLCQGHVSFSALLLHWATALTHRKIIQGNYRRCISLEIKAQGEKTLKLHLLKLLRKQFRFFGPKEEKEIMIFKMFILVAFVLESITDVLAVCLFVCLFWTVESSQSNQAFIIALK